MTSDTVDHPSSMPGSDADPDADPVTPEWEEAIAHIAGYRHELSALDAERDALASQRIALGRRLFEVEGEIARLQAKILMAFEAAARVDYGAAQLLRRAEGSLGVG